ncbi:MAG: hypothetical protein ACK47B_18670 [Armatimonadota bacterium]
MTYCPECGAAFSNWTENCPDCDVPLEQDAEAAVPQAEWVRVYTGAGQPLRVVEGNLKAMGIPVVRLPGEGLSQYPFTTIGMADETLLWSLAVPADVHRTRADLVGMAVTAAQSVRDGDEEAIAEAEEDYDVRGCPECLLFFHDTYEACPGCGQALVPAVEIFEEGQLEPDRVVVGHGTAEKAKALAQRLEAAGFGAEAFEMEGWSVAAVELPWGELTTRTAQAEAVLNGEGDA